MKLSKRWTVLLIIIGVIIIIRVSLPYAILHYANSTMRDIPQYSGHIKDIDLHLLPGKYSIQNVEIVWLKDKEWVQILTIPSVEFKILWDQLLKGKIVASANVVQPVITIYERMLLPTKPKINQKAITQVFRELSPVYIDLFTIKDAQIRFRNYYTEPNYVLYADSIYVTIRNITNMQRLTSPTYASMDLTGKVLKSGNLSMHLLFNPIQTPPNFYVAMKLLNLEVNSLDTFSRAYGGFDFDKGTMDLVTEISMKDQKINGYVKPLFKNLQVFSWTKDVKEKKKDALKLFWEAIVGATSEIFENQKHDQLATRIPISGTVSDPNIDMITAVSNVLRDAFVKAFMPTLEKNVKPPNKK